MVDYDGTVGLICNSSPTSLAAIKALRSRAMGDNRLTRTQRLLAKQIIDRFLNLNPDAEALRDCVMAPALTATKELSVDLMALEGRVLIRKSLGQGTNGFLRHAYLPLLSQADFKKATKTTAPRARGGIKRAARKNIGQIAA
jgi:hypothetical protein